MSLLHRSDPFSGRLNRAVLLRIGAAAGAFLISLPADTAPPAPPPPLPLAPGTAEVVRDVLPLAEKARTQDASLFTVRRPVPASGVLKDAVFLHPQRIGRPARAEFTLALPRIASGERLLLAFDIGLSDGIPDAGHARLDGVRFAVEAEGKRLFESDWRESRWQPGAADLTALAGRTARLAFLADPKASLEYDWALFGEPRLIRISAAPKAAAAVASQTSDIVTGVAVVSHSSGRTVRVRLVPEGGGKDTPVEWCSVPVSGSDRRVTAALDFSFPRARSVRIVVEGDNDARRSLRIARYRAHPVLTHVTATAAAPRAGSVVPLRIEMRNRGRGLLAAKQARVTLFLNGKRIGQKSVDAALAPGERWRTEFAWRAPKKPGVFTLKTRIEGSGKQSLSGSVETFAAPERANTVSVENGSLRVEFVRSGGGFAYGRALTRSGGGWLSVGTLRPLLRGSVATPTGGEREWEVRPRLVRVSGREIVFTETGVPDPQGVPWNVRLSVTLDPVRPLARLRYSWTPARERAIAALWGPSLYVNDNASAGDAKLWGLFPGLEYLYRGEPSSSTRGFAPPLHDRRTPHPWKVTVPLMAVSVSADGSSAAAAPLNLSAFWSPDSLKDGAGNHPVPNSPSHTVALWWDPLQKWDALNSRAAYPSARFNSPNDEQGMDNHRLGLFLPSVPDHVDENRSRARSPYRIRAGQTLTLEATLWVGEGPALAALGAWVRDRGGLPAPPAPPRSHEAVFGLSRTAYEKTVWNPQTRRWRSTIEGGDETVAAAAALLLLDSRTAADTADRKRSANLAEAGIQSMLEQSGPGALVSREGSHILRWELPFLYGYLPEAFAALEQEIDGILAAQQPDGGWRFGPRDPVKATLGATGDSVSGVNSHHAWMLLRYARVTGDARAREAGLKALRFIERFRIPRGASVWECPIYEPDILASSWLLAACLEGWQATGETRWLHDAIYWAESATPFIYLWSVPDRPAMLGASIPIFGTTFYTHSWLATPVQWEGLTLAFHLRRLAGELETAGTPDAGGSPLPLALKFASGDWRRLADLLTVSGLHQQIASGERIGTYPDSITDFTRPNPVFIHPENILANLFWEKGVVPDIQTARRGRLVVSAAGNIAALEAASGNTDIRFTLTAFAGHISGVLVHGMPSPPQRVLVDRLSLSRSSGPLKREPGWFWDQSRSRLYLNVLQTSSAPSEIAITP